MATVDQHIAKANEIAARLARYASLATAAAQAGDRAGARHWTRRREQDETRLESARRELDEVRRRERLRIHAAVAPVPSRRWGETPDDVLEARIRHIDAEVRNAELDAPVRAMGNRVDRTIAELNAGLPPAYRMPVIDRREIEQLYDEHGGEG